MLTDRIAISHSFSPLSRLLAYLSSRRKLYSIKSVKKLAFSLSRDIDDK